MGEGGRSTARVRQTPRERGERERARARRECERGWVEMVRERGLGKPSLRQRANSVSVCGALAAAHHGGQPRENSGVMSEYTVLGSLEPK